jgi:hypothetical protein
MRLRPDDTGRRVRPGRRRFNAHGSERWSARAAEPKTDTDGSGNAAGTGGALADEPANVCDFPAPTPSTPEEVDRNNLLRSFCTALIDAGCSYSLYGRVSELLASCSRDDRIRACMIDSYNDYYAYVETPECDALWQAAAQCMAQATSTEGCQYPPSIIVYLDGDPPKPCDAEKEAFGASCWNQVNGSVTGSRGLCGYGPSSFSNEVCYVSCQNGEQFEGRCDGNPGMPLVCTCYLNGHVIWDDALNQGVEFLAADCRDVALRMASGTCFETVDCCFTWSGPETPPQQHCSCTADPGKLGYDTCEAAAAGWGGHVVDLCPQYTDDPDCLHPTDAGCL